MVSAGYSAFGGQIVRNWTRQSQRLNAEFRVYSQIAYPLQMLLTALFLCFPPQDVVLDTPLPGTDEAIALERLEEMNIDEQEETLYWILDDLSQIEHPFPARLKQLVTFQNSVEMASWSPYLAFEPSKYAPALNLKTKRVKRSSSRWKSIARKVYGKNIPAPYEQDWQWSFAQHKLLEPTHRTPPTAAILGLLKGHLPRKKYWKTLTKGALDWSRLFEKSANYFAHVYRDRDGHIYEGIRLHDVWASGASFGISDCEAIAWCHLIGNTTQFVSPLSTSSQSRVYSRIEDDYKHWREYQTLIDLVATKFLDPESPLPKGYDENVSDTLNMAWVMVDNDLEKMRALLQQHSSRTALFDAVKKWKLTPPSDICEDDWHVHILEGLEARMINPKPIQESALASLKAEGLLGLGRR